MIRLVGSHQLLGRWDLNDAVMLETSGGPWWWGKIRRVPPFSRLLGLCIVHILVVGCFGCAYFGVSHILVEKDVGFRVGRICWE